MNERMKYVIEVCVVVFLVATLLPPALDMIANTATTNWNTAVVTIFKTLLSILVIVGIALALMPEEFKSKLGI